MKKIFTFFLVINIHLTLLFVPVLKISASTGLTVYPFFAELSVNQSYKLNIQNNFNESKNIIIKPTIFEINTQEDTLTNIDSEIQKLLIKNINEYLQVEKSSFELLQGQTEEIEIKLLKEPPKQYLIGVSVEATSISKNIQEAEKSASLSSSVSSVIISNQLSEELTNQINTKIIIDCGFSLFGICFGNSFNVKTEIQNNSFGFIKASGEIGVYDGEQKIGSVGLTQNLQKSIYPTKTELVESRFVDSRGFFDRIGELKFAQNISVREKSFYQEGKVVVVTGELVLGLIGFLILIVFGVILIGKKNSMKSNTEGLVNSGAK